MSPIRAVIFDLDGCLVDSEQMSLSTLAAALTEAGLPVTQDALRQRFLGVSIRSICAQLTETTGHRFAPDFAAQFETRLLARYAGEGLDPVPGIPALLEGLSQSGIATAIATGSSVLRMQASLRAAGLDALFADRGFSADQVARGKPAPDLFLLAADKLGIPPSACAVMEDSPLGVTGARAAGMRAVGFVGGSHLAGMRQAHAGRLREAGAAAVLGALDGMLSALLDEAGAHGAV